MLDDAGFRALFAGTSIKRTGRARFQRNVLIAIGNASEAGLELVEAARRCLDDPSPLVRGAAVWAFGRIADRGEIATTAKARGPAETDPDVRAEWERLLEPAELA
jgi:epoxyqueuosine reductase